MGQQQLILLALAVVIVGGAIVVGIRAFTESSHRANHDALMQDAVRIANDLQAWKQKPAPFGGQSACASTAVVQDANDFECATWARLGYAPDPGAITDYVNLNGRFRLTVASADSTAVVAINTIQNNEIVIGVTGVTDRDISGTTACQGGTDDAGAACTAAF